VKSDADRLAVQRVAYDVAAGDEPASESVYERMVSP